MTERSAIDAMLKRLVALEAENQRLREERDRLTLRWTADKPTVAGFYFYRHPSGRITIGWFAMDSGTGLLATPSGYLWTSEAKGQWAGPIPAPGEVMPAASPPAPPSTIDPDPDTDTAMTDLIGPEEF